jgi:hypothetical protein
MRYRIEKIFLGILSNGEEYNYFIVKCKRWWWFYWRLCKVFCDMEDSIKYVNTFPRPYRSPETVTVWIS